MDSTTKYVYDIFKNFQGLIACNHSSVYLKWKSNSLDFNTHGDEYNLAFDSSNYTFWATYVNAIGEKVHVTQKVFINLVENTKIIMLRFFSTILLVSMFFVFFWYFAYLLFCNYTKKLTLMFTRELTTRFPTSH